MEKKKVQKTNPESTSWKSNQIELDSFIPIHQTLL